MDPSLIVVLTKLPDVGHDKRVKLASFTAYLARRYCSNPLSLNMPEDTTDIAFIRFATADLARQAATFFECHVFDRLHTLGAFVLSDNMEYAVQAMASVQIQILPPSDW
jgi:hypothetical protein